MNWPLAWQSIAAPFVNLGPSDNLAADQPSVQVALYTQPDAGSPTDLGPDPVYNSFVLDTGSTTILIAGQATGSLSSNFQTVATYYEAGVAGTSPTQVSAPYRFDYAGTDGMTTSLPSVRVLTSDLDLGDINGIAGTPLMVGRNTTVDLTAIKSDYTSRVAFSQVVPPGNGHRYDVPLQMVNFPLDGQQNPTDPLPTYAPLSVAPVRLRNGSRVAEGRFIVDTGAQISFFSTAMAAALGINPATDSIGSLQVGGIGGTVDMPIVATDSIAVHTRQGTDLKWTGLQVGVLDIDPKVAGVLGMDLLSSGWLDAAFFGGSGYLSELNFDFRNSANLTGDMLIDVDPGHDVVSSGDNTTAWDLNGSGGYSETAKWYSAVVPSGAGVTATFGNGILNTVSGPTVTVTVDAADVVGALVFGNTQGTGYILANDGVSGHGITLDNGGLGAFVTVVQGVSVLQQIQANIVLADNATFDIASGSSLLITVGGIGETGASRSITLASGGTLTIDAPSSYTGGTTVNNGTLTTTAIGTLGPGPLAVNADDAIISVVNLGSNQTVGGLSGTLTGTGSAQVNVAAGTTLSVKQSSNTTFAGVVALSAGVAANSGGKLTKSGAGALEIDGAPTLNNSSSLVVNDTGILRFKATSGTATIGTGVTATVSNSATLELAGSVSALSAGANRVNILNNSSATAGILVSGAHQQVGRIDGNGNTQINAGSDLTANHIIQNALTIGGAATSHGLVTINSSDASGNPLIDAPASLLSDPGAAGLIVANSMTPSRPFGADGMSTANLSAAGGTVLPALPLGDSVVGGNLPPVPEPSTLVLMLVAVASLIARSSCRGARELE